VTRSHRHPPHDEPPHKPKRDLSGNRPWRTRLVAWAVVAVVAVGGFTLVFDRKDLPARIKDNAYVAKLYHERDTVITTTEEVIGRHEKKPEAPDANADMKQQGYNKDDRSKLNNIITNSGDKTE
jgi:hypothetical protein